MKKIILSLIIAAGAFTASAAPTPSFPGGETAMTTYIAENLQYPAMAKENGIEGMVAVTFMVQPDGSIGNIKIKRMIDPDLEAEAIRLVKGMPKWTPADNNGTPVAAPVEIEIPFLLQ